MAGFDNITNVDLLSLLVTIYILYNPYYLYIYTLYKYYIYIIQAVDLSFRDFGSSNSLVHDCPVPPRAFSPWPGPLLWQTLTGQMCHDWTSTQTSHLCFFKNKTHNIQLKHY